MEIKPKELGQFLRVLRERISPEAMGFSAGGRRRTPGLRREEVAELCGISSTWYTWIEQGRKVSVSAKVLERLAISFELSDAERFYLFELAGKGVEEKPVIGADEYPGILERIVREIPSPAYILNGSWEAIFWNDPAESLFRGWLDKDAKTRNLLRYMFLEPYARRLVAGWEERARRLVSDFRADCGRRLSDPPVRELIEELQAGSADFRKYWKQQDVSWREGGPKRFNHPVFESVSYEQATFRLVSRRDLKLTVLVCLKANPKRNA
ncbi:MAG: helix-turn-helix transcriptional regulator [Leptospirales bacterium]